MEVNTEQCRRGRPLVHHADRSAIYVRISDDKEGAGLGVERQEKDARDLAARLNLPIANVYVDNDMSAYSRRTVRKGYQQLMADLRAGAFSTVIVWHLDRLYRQPRELEDMIDLCADGQRKVISCFGDYDLSSSDGIFMARIMVAQANKESADKSRRISRKMAELAERGLPHHGGLRAFGYTADGMSLVSVEAQAVRDAADRVLAGDSLRSICMDLNARGLRTTQHNLWSTPRLRTILLSARISGLIEHHRAGRVQAQWPAIITEKERMRLQAILTDPRRTTGRGAPRRFLLSPNPPTDGRTARMVVSE